VLVLAGVVIALRQSVSRMRCSVLTLLAGPVRKPIQSLWSAEMSNVKTPKEIASSLPELWSPRVVAEVDDAYIKVAKVQGTFDWHSHQNEDELFFVLKGSLRIGPIGEDRRSLGSLWRIWAQGDEVYIANRNGAKLVKISIHSSGKPFISAGKNDRWDFAQPMLLPDSEWRLIAEICFLIGENILPLRDMKELKASKPALGIVTPRGHKLPVYVLFGGPPPYRKATQTAV